MLAAGVVVVREALRLSEPLTQAAAAAAERAGLMSRFARLIYQERKVIQSHPLARLALSEDQRHLAAAIQLFLQEANLSRLTVVVQVRRELRQHLAAVVAEPDYPVSVAMLLGRPTVPPGRMAA